MVRVRDLWSLVLLVWQTAAKVGEERERKRVEHRSERQAQQRERAEDGQLIRVAQVKLSASSSRSSEEKREEVEGEKAKEGEGGRRREEGEKERRRGEERATEGS